jgi:hypothetical protein
MNILLAYSTSKNKDKLSLLPASAGFLLGFFGPWRWRLYVPPKRRAISELHGVTSQKTVSFIVTVVRTPNPTM